MNWGVRKHEKKKHFKETNGGFMIMCDISKREKPVVENICRVCPIPKKFSNKSNLKQHMKNKHNGRNDQIRFGSSFLQLSQNEVDLQKTKVVVCNICKNEFTCQENLIKHEKEEHNTDSSVQ